MEDVCRAVTGAYPGEYITDFERCYYIYCTCIRVMITTFDNLIIFIFIFFFLFITIFVPAFLSSIIITIVFFVVLVLILIGLVVNKKRKEKQGDNKAKKKEAHEATMSKEEVLMEKYHKYNRPFGVKFKIIISFAQILSSFGTMLPIQFTPDHKDKDAQTNGIVNIDPSSFIWARCFLGGSGAERKLMFMTLFPLAVGFVALIAHQGVRLHYKGAVSEFCVDSEMYLIFFYTVFEML